MAERIITYRSMTKTYVFIFLGIAWSLPFGHFIAEVVLPLATLDWLVVTVVFLGLPILMTAIGFVIGWNGKKNALEYHEPTWSFEPIQLSIEEAKALDKKYKQNYRLMVANSNYWIFFIPTALIIFSAALPVYLFFENPSLSGLGAWLFALSLSISYLVASIGALRATSNSASEDFTLLLVREAIRLAKSQENIPGLSHVRIVLDKAEENGFTVYEAPRVVSRVSGLEKEGYIESWSEELGAVNRVLVRLYKDETHPEVVWWWFSEDRFFRKFVGDDKKGYYVRYPRKYKRGNPGVKDISEIIENAVAIMILEWIQTRGENEELSRTLTSLNIERE
ncbi:MAG: hypothetical protein ACFFCP_16905 [Promethearchaeota archaeon]